MEADSHCVDEAPASEMESTGAGRPGSLQEAGTA